MNKFKLDKMFKLYDKDGDLLDHSMEGDLMTCVIVLTKLMPGVISRLEPVEFEDKEMRRIHEDSVIKAYDLLKKIYNEPFIKNDIYKNIRRSLPRLNKARKDPYESTHVVYAWSDTYNIWYGILEDDLIDADN